MMCEALAVHAAIVIALVLIHWATSVKINVVSFIDAFPSATIIGLLFLSFTLAK
ncbi:MAG: hypothetical protein ACK4RT_10445 [Erythrobacter sp.]